MELSIKEPCIYQMRLFFTAVFAEFFCKERGVRFMLICHAPNKKKSLSSLLPPRRCVKKSFAFVYDIKVLSAIAD